MPRGERQGDLRAVELGKSPRSEDSRTGAAPVVVVSHSFWSSALGGDPEIIGRTLELDATLVEVVGVMEARVGLPISSPSIWRPIARDRTDITDRSGHNLSGIGVITYDDHHWWNKEHDLYLLHP